MMHNSRSLKKELLDNLFQINETVVMQGRIEMFTYNTSESHKI